MGDDACVKQEPLKTITEVITTFRLYYHHPYRHIIYWCEKNCFIMQNRKGNESHMLTW